MAVIFFSNCGYSRTILEDERKYIAHVRFFVLAKNGEPLVVAVNATMDDGAQALCRQQVEICVLAYRRLILAQCFGGKLICFVVIDVYGTVGACEDRPRAT